MYLLVDNREKNVIPFINYPYKLKTLLVGDYQVINNDKIVACFERKTYKDFVASIYDGRHLNYEKMTILHKNTNCKLYLIIEGKPSKVICRMSYKNVIKELDNILINTNIQIFYTDNIIDTINRIKYYMDNTINVITDININSTINIKSYIRLDINSEVKLSDNSIMCYIWTRLPKITNNIALSLICNVSIYEVLTNKEIIKTIKLNTGKQLSYKVVNVLNNLNKYSDKLLSAINGISKNTAELLLLKYNLTELINIKNVENLSDKKLNKIQYYFKYKK